MKRVVVTGLGAVTPLGNSVQEFWNGIVSGQSGAGPITHFDASKFKVRFACEVKNFDPTLRLEHAERKRTDLFAQYALDAAAQAMEDSGLEVQAMDPFDIGVIWGSGQGGMNTFETEVADFTTNGGEPRFNPFFIPKIIANIAPGLISMKYGLQGINYAAISACATSNTAIMDAYNYIKWGKAKAFITGGSEAPITSACVGGFSALKAMSQNNEHPKEASRPMDVNRDGFVIGEGAGALILEEYEHARKRGAKIYAEVIGAAMTADAYHMTATHPDGLGATRGMQMAMEEAGINPEQVDYLNMHATSTPIGDISEIKAIQNVFGTAPNLSMSGTKSMIGHLLGAAGAAEAIISIKSITDGIAPPTINVHNIDPAVPKEFHLVTNESVKKEINIAMSNTFGFGGHNGIVIFRKV